MHSYLLKYETITVNNINYQIRSLQDKQQFFDKDNRAEALGISSATWPLFGVVWPSSRILATAVSKFTLTGKKVLEIGCGIALSSIVLHKMGVNITASDYHPLAEPFLEENVQSNQLPPIKYQAGNWENDNPLLGKFDLIIGSDVLYEPGHPAAVSEFINCHADTHAEVIIVDPNRGNRSNFTKKMIALGYTHDFNKFDETDINEARCKGRILRYQR